MLLFGIVSGPNKPHSLQPYIALIVNELLAMEFEPIEIFDACVQQSFRIFARILIVVADNPAHQLINVQQGSRAREGCHKCYIVGEHNPVTKSMIYQCEGKQKSLGNLFTIFFYLFV
jgi:hypothetical protein